MPSALPDGEPAPSSGELPESALSQLPGRPFGIYVHVPFCSVRCGYCDFNTYTLTELGVDGASVASYADAALAELDLATSVLGPGAPAVSTVFVGGGTPTLLAARDLVRVLDGIRERFGLTAGAEVTTEANPDSVTPESLRVLADGGFTRVSIGMQSAVPSVLATLERTHDPANVRRAVDAARAAGLKVSVDLIYGTPGESVQDWRESLAAAIALGPDHISAYALVVEQGTKLAAQVRRGQVPAPEDDDEAAKYEIADEVLAAAGYRWYEVSNWAPHRRGPLPPQRGLLDRRQLVGRRPRRAQPRRRRSLVERQAPQRLCHARRRWPVTGGGPRAAHRRAAVRRAGAAGGAPRRRPGGERAAAAGTFGRGGPHRRRAGRPRGRPGTAPRRADQAGPTAHRHRGAAAARRLMSQCV